MMAKRKIQQTPRYKAINDNQLPLLQQRLILNRFFCHQFGFEDFKKLREYFRLGGHKDREGWAEDGHSFFFRALEDLSNLKVTRDKLAEYDLRIKAYEDRLNRARQQPVRLKYFQYLAVLFTELFLDRFFNEKERLLAELNAFLKEGNWAPISDFTEDDLTKVAFWMATGSGKTLIMHINLWQYLHYSEGKVKHDNILLITPNEGLSKQHIDEFRKSGIAAQHYGEAGGTVFSSGNSVVVTVIEITKLTESKRGGRLSVEVDAFGDNNLLLVDEGHRGAKGEVWRELRAKLAQRGFTFEYSATFGQIVNGASRDKRLSLLNEYAKAILFDYSYPHFYHDGYGKDYWIVNLKDETNAFNEWMLLGNLLSFYEQCIVYDEYREALRPYNLEKPLWVFVGHSVTGGKSQEDKDSLTDVEQIIAFFDDFLRDKDKWVKRISELLKGQSGLQKPNGEDLFKEQFGYLRCQKCPADELYSDIVRRVFHASVGETLRAVELKAAPGEIGLRVGASNPYFGVINIGDVAGLMKLLEGHDISCEGENITGSLFDSINKPDSTVNVLIGSRKFMEGWDSFRVASMGLMNIGKGEGSQIIQLFGRGVRLWGKEYSLKRSSALPADKAPPYIKLLETLNVFGVRANYMAQFREYLKQEGIEVEFEEIHIPVKVQKEFLERDLQVLRLPENSSFVQEEGIVVDLDKSIKVTLDLRPRIETNQSQSGEEIMGRMEIKKDRSSELKRFASLLNWQRIYFKLLDFKQVKGWHNVSFTIATLQDIVEKGNYQLFCPDGYLQPQRVTDLLRIEEIAIGVLCKYLAAFYDRKRRAWEETKLTLKPLTEDDPNLTLGGNRCYTLRIAKRENTETFIQQVRELVEQADKLYRQDVENFPNIHFDRHLYQPLLLADKRIDEMTPPGLNEGEAKFVRDLRKYLQENRDRFSDKEFFLLRNLTRGKGIGFFEEGEGEAFYPDFILWVIEGNTQKIAFIDPHGIRNTRGISDPKVQLYRKLREIQKQLLSPVKRVGLTSFIIALGTYEEAKENTWVRGYLKEEMEQEHILFQGDTDYIEKMIKILTEIQI